MAVPPNAEYVSPDGRVTYNSNQQRLDSLGNVAYGNPSNVGQRGPRPISRDDLAVGGWEGFSNPTPAQPYLGYRDDAPRPQTSGEYSPGDSFAPPGQYQPLPSQNMAQNYSMGNFQLPGTAQQYLSIPQDQDRNRQLMQEWAQINLPYQQAWQNQYQYELDRLQSMAQFDASNQLARDQFNAQNSLSQRGMTLQEQQALRNQANWNTQFGLESNLAYRSADRADNQLSHQIGMDSRAADFQEQQWREQYGLQSGQQRHQQSMDQAYLGLRAGDQVFNQNMASRQFDEGARQFNAQLNLSQTAQNQAWQNQLFNQNLSRDQYNLGAQAQSWNQAFSQNRADTQDNQWNRQFGEDTRRFDTQFGETQRQYDMDEAFRRYQSEQQNTQFQQNQALQERMANVAATGRALAPNTRWLRNT